MLDGKENNNTDTQVANGAPSDYQSLLDRMDDDGKVKSEAVKPDANDKSTDGKPGPTGADTVKTETDEGAKPAGEKPDGGDGKPELFAGKFHDADALQKGVTEISKALGVPESMAKRVIQPLIDAEDWKGLSDAYLEMQTEYEAKKKPDVPGKADEEPDTQINLTAEDKKEIDQIVAQELLQSDVYKEMKDAGIAFGEDNHVFPRTSEELRQLKLEFPAYYNDFLKSVHETREIVTSVRKTMSERDTMIDKAKVEGIEFITNFGKKHSLELKDTDITALVDELLKLPDAYTDKNGIKVPKKSAIKKLFYAEKIEGYLDTIALNAEKRGRTQTDEDRKKIDSKIIDTASTAGRKASHKDVSSTAVDLKDQKKVDLLPKEKISEEIARIITKMEE